jgi:hypothetical protein
VSEISFKELKELGFELGHRIRVLTRHKIGCREPDAVRSPAAAVTYEGIRKRSRACRISIQNHGEGLNIHNRCFPPCRTMTHARPSSEWRGAEQMCTQKTLQRSPLPRHFASSYFAFWFVGWFFLRNNLRLTRPKISDRSRPQVECGSHLKVEIPNLHREHLRRPVYKFRSRATGSASTQFRTAESIARPKAPDRR